MAKGGHGLPKVSPGSARPYPSMPAGGLRTSSTLLDTSRRTPMEIIETQSETREKIVYHVSPPTPMMKEIITTWTHFESLITFRVLTLESLERN
jgi:hypothetical protein